VVHDVGEEPVEDLQGSVNLAGDITVDVGEEKVEELLPDSVILVFSDGTLDLDGEIAYLVGKALSDRGGAVEGLED
jgi:hypothetical protein